ncbi:MAG: hypothetical protein KME05_15410 [Gloeocapsa sp. UFS-A4-WI-NPMV-4B04]|jgi:hypothetical protein|nr:hypothetical protein [Gloeocapsa sp. UFS-A4-WI-NPMV-4B04]
MIGKIWLWRYLNSTEPKMSNGFYRREAALANQAASTPVVGGEQQVEASVRSQEKIT